MNKYGGGGEERKRCGVGGKKSGGGAGQERKIGREVGARNQEPLGGRVAALSARPGEAHHRCTGHRARDSDRLTASNHTPRSRPRAAEPVGELATRTQTTPRVTGRGTEQGHHTTTTDAPSSPGVPRPKSRLSVGSALPHPPPRPTPPWQPQPRTAADQTAGQGRGRRGGQWSWPTRRAHTLRRARPLRVPRGPPGWARQRSGWLAAHRSHDKDTGDVGGWCVARKLVPPTTCGRMSGCNVSN